MSNIIKTALLMGGLLWQSMGLASDTGWLASPQHDHAKVRLQADTRDPAQTRVLLSLELAAALLLLGAQVIAEFERLGHSAPAGAAGFRTPSASHG